MSVQPITLVPMRDISALLAPQPGRRQPLVGFDADYVDIVDYIIRCTHRIWEQKRVDLIRSHYTDDCLIHTLAGPSRGVESVVQGTLRTLAAFPDRTLYGDDVIWDGNDRDGFLSSHRITSHMTNLGASDFGAATGRRATVMTIADCAVRANRIYEEWLVRDNLGLVLQLGLDPFAIARDQARRAAGAQDAGRSWRAHEYIRVSSGVTLRGVASEVRWRGDPVEFARTALPTLWHDAALGAVREVYSGVAELHGPSGRELLGHGEIAGWYGRWLGALSEVRVVIDHVGAVERDAGYDIAIRWTLAGVHSGPGLLRAARGEPIVILGVTHWRVVDGTVTEEWTVFDELAILQQCFETES